MTEWWTYRPADFLMFAPSTWWRLFELHNAAAWPLQPLLLALGAGGLLALWRAHTGTLRAVLALLAPCWAGVAWCFLWQRFAPINWAAEAYAVGFGAMAFELALAAAAGGAGALGVTAVPARRATGLALFGAALLYPLLAPLTGRPWTQAELLGLAPDPTAIATLGVLLLMQARGQAMGALLLALRAGALAWCAISAATLFTMEEAQGIVPLAAALAALAALATPGPRRAAHGTMPGRPGGP